MRVDQAGDERLLAITDEGAGVPAEHRDRIFNRVFRINEARSRERGGAGVGLAIGKWAVEIHGGRITVHEARDGGSEFRISLPLAESSPTHQQRGT